MQISPAVPRPIIEFPRTPAAPVELPLTQLQITEGVGAEARPTTQLVQDLYVNAAAGLEKAIDRAELTTFHRGRMLANTTPMLDASAATKQAAAAVFDALTASAALMRGIESASRQVILRDTMVVKWEGVDGRTLATRVPLDPTSGRAADAQDAPLVDAIRAWQHAAGVTAALDAQVAATAALSGHNS